MIFALKRFADFPKYRLSSQFLLIVSTKAPLLYFAWHFGPETTGQLGLALTMIALPMTLFGQTTAQAYYAEIAKIGKKNPEKIYNITKNITKKLFLVSIPPFLILLIGGPWLFQFVFGEIWREAGVFASILAIYLLSQFVDSPIVNALNVFEKQGYFLQINIVRCVIILVVFFLSFVFKFSTINTLMTYSVGLSLQRVFVYIRIMKTIKKFQAVI